MTSKSFIHLPLEILVNIVKHLELNDIRILMLTCKTLHNLIINESIFMRLIFRNKLVIQDRERYFINEYIEKMDTVHPFHDFLIEFLLYIYYFNDFSEQNPYSYYNRCRISHNFHKGIYRNKILIQHNTNYMPWLQFVHSDTLYLSVGSELKCYALNKKGLSPCNFLWSIKVPTVKRHDIRTNDISRFIVKDGIIICGNRDGNVAVYETNNNQRPNLISHIKNCHENGNVEISAVERLHNSVVTTSQNSPNVCFWNYENLKKYASNRLHSSWSFSGSMTSIEISNETGCRCVAVNNLQDKLAIGLNGNSKPVILDVNIGKPLMTSENTRSARHLIRDIQWHNENAIVYVSHSGKLELIDVRSNDLVYETTDPFLSSLYCVKTDSDHALIVGSAEYSRCVLFDLRSTQHLQMFFTQKKSSCIYSLDFDSTRLIAAADRGVAALNFNVNTSTNRMRDYSHTFEVIRG